MQEWLVGNKMSTELEKMTRLAYSKAITHYIKKRRGEALESVREELEWVLRQAVQYTMCGDPGVKKQHSVTTILREVITNPRCVQTRPRCPVLRLRLRGRTCGVGVSCTRFVQNEQA